MPDLIERAAANSSGKAAVITSERTVTYDVLFDRARRIAGALREHGVRPGDIVAVCTRRDPDYVASALAVWFAGGAFMPLDPGLPEARKEYMLTTAGVHVTLAKGDVDPSPSMKLLDVEQAWQHEPLLDPAAVKADDPAFVIYTSGSTGRPKGVVLTHRGLAGTINALLARPVLRARPVGLAVCAQTFDVSVFDMMYTLASGGTVVLADPEERVDPDAIAGLVRDHGVGWVAATPTWMHMLVTLRPDCLRGVLAICAGELLTSTLVSLLLDAGAVVWNAYGPTETTVFTAIHELPEAITGAAPVGRMLAGEIAIIVDDNGEQCPPGEPGMLYIGGCGVGLGYVGTEANSASFIDDPVYGRLYRTGDIISQDETGLMRFIGRDDDQVKVRGFRIELGELESAALEHSRARNSAAWVFDAPVLGPVLTLAVQMDDLDAEAPEATLKRELTDVLAARLPEYMLPGRTVLLGDWPTNPNGKTDKAALRALIDQE
ncbi:amino acid adenylation domain-containing protein [Solihabitans fulvus]|uniref:amino acid adenylation domain-containing protein n=1 Tax=Solihabitans fulvus TaxID=1892852 RepID=UPI001661FA72|nr:amino acid adenylation domain-containing protein [Solihabitans fulvus]